MNILSSLISIDFIYHTWGRFFSIMIEKPGTNALKIDKQILDKFWTLSEASASSTVKATNQLVELLIQKQRQNKVIV